MIQQLESKKIQLLTVSRFPGNEIVDYLSSTAGIGNFRLVDEDFACAQLEMTNASTQYHAMLIQIPKDDEFANQVRDYLLDHLGAKFAKHLDVGMHECDLLYAKWEKDV